MAQTRLTREHPKIRTPIIYISITNLKKAQLFSSVMILMAVTNSTKANNSSKISYSKSSRSLRQIDNLHIAVFNFNKSILIDLGETKPKGNSPSSIYYKLWRAGFRCIYCIFVSVATQKKITNQNQLRLIFIGLKHTATQPLFQLIKPKT